MAENLFVINEGTSEGTSKNINVREVEDFVQQGKLTKYELSEDNKYIQIEFTNTKGQISNRRMYLPKDASEYSSDEKYKKAISIFMGNMANVSRKYMGDTYTTQGTTAVEIATKVIRDITPKLFNVVLFCLMELNKNDKGIFTNVGAFSPFSMTGTDLVVSKKQKDLLQEKLNYKPDADKVDNSFDPLGLNKPQDDNPF